MNDIQDLLCLFPYTRMEDLVHKQVADKLVEIGLRGNPVLNGLLEGHIFQVSHNVFATSYGRITKLFISWDNLSPSGFFLIRKTNHDLPFILIQEHKLYETDNFQILFAVFSLAFLRLPSFSRTFKFTLPLWEGGLCFLCR